MIRPRLIPVARPIQKALVRGERALLANLRKLDQTTLEKRLDSYLNRKESDALLGRRDQIVKLFGDDIESLRQFDVSTQRSTNSIPEVVIAPAREIILTDQRVNQAIMELGALVCTARVARCGDCPVRPACLTGRRG